MSALAELMKVEGEGLQAQLAVTQAGEVVD